MNMAQEKLQLAKEWYNDPSATEEEKSHLEELFPELKESENERIRKEIIEALKQLDREKCPVDTYPYLDWIAWLEKQGSINEKLRQYREYLVKETERWHKNEENETLSKIGKQDCIGHANAYISARSEFEDLFNYDSWLEKQGNVYPTEDELEALRIAAYEPSPLKNWSEKLQSLYEKLAFELPRCKDGDCQDFNKHIQEGDIIVINENGERVNISQLNRVAKPREWIEDYWQHHKVNNPSSYDGGDEIQFDHDGFVRFCNTYCKKPNKEQVA